MPTVTDYVKNGLGTVKFTKKKYPTPPIVPSGEYLAKVSMIEPFNSGKNGYGDALKFKFEVEIPNARPIQHVVFASLKLSPGGDGFEPSKLYRIVNAVFGDAPTVEGDEVAIGNMLGQKCRVVIDFKNNSEDQTIVDFLPLDESGIQS